MDLQANHILDRIYRHASTTYPEECCGFVMADGSVHQGTNIQNDLNRRDPGLHPRRAATGYTFSVADTLLLNRSFETCSPVAVIYHSHPDVGAYFSQEDTVQALFAGEPIYPVSYLVVDVRADAVHGAKVFEWDGQRFACRRQIPFQALHPSPSARSTS